jgi:hypothetical protein
MSIRSPTVILQALTLVSLGSMTMYFKSHHDYNLQEHEARMDELEAKAKKRECHQLLRLREAITDFAFVGKVRGCTQIGARMRRSSMYEIVGFSN